LSILRDTLGDKSNFPLMRIQVKYGAKNYGTADGPEKYRITVVNDGESILVRFSFAPVSGINEAGDAYVKEGSLSLSPQAARRLAQVLIQMTDADQAKPQRDVTLDFDDGSRRF
jgi:hypothetical protein